MTHFDGEENYIAWIHNYCDRWCERCSFTARCRVFAMEQEDSPTDEERGINSEAFWRKLAGIFAQTQVMLREKAEEFGIDLVAVDDEAIRRQIEKRRSSVLAQDLVKLAENYAKAVGKAIDGKEDFAGSIEEETRYELLEIVRWYQLFIGVKIYRGSDAKTDEDEGIDDELRESILYEKNGSIKIALIAIDRSIAAWSGLLTSENYVEVQALISLLETIREKAEKEFPNARDFLRPGFDEIETVM